jgi:hypothetical protein
VPLGCKGSNSLRRFRAFSLAASLGFPRARHETLGFRRCFIHSKDPAVQYSPVCVMRHSQVYESGKVACRNSEDCKRQGHACNVTKCSSAFPAQPELRGFDAQKRVLTMMLIPAIVNLLPLLFHCAEYTCWRERSRSKTSFNFRTS